MNFERWSSLVVRYWAVNMTMIHDMGSNWPGFGYSDEEKKELGQMARMLSRGEFYSFLAVVTVIALPIFAAIVVGGMYSLIAVIGGEQNMPNTPAVLFFFSLALECVASLTIGLPMAMLLGAALVGRKVPSQDLPDAEVTARYFRKMWFQITRMTLIMLVVVMPMWIFVPNDSKFMVMLRLVVPLLSPVVSILTLGYYMTGKVGRVETASR
jgi:hypothetical protein